MSLNASSTNAERALAAWGKDMPEWVRQLAVACDQTNQRVVGERLDLSSATVSKVLNCKYPGDIQRMERLVRAAYSADRVDCPLFGPIPLATCLRARSRKGTPGNHLQFQFAQTCPTCPNNTDSGRSA